MPVVDELLVGKQKGRKQIIIDEKITPYTIKEVIGKAWDKIHGAFNKVRTFIMSLRHNINYFKNATLPQKMSEDLQFLLQNLTPRREYINKLFPLLMNDFFHYFIYFCFYSVVVIIF